MTTVRDLMRPCPTVIMETTVANLVERMTVDPEYFYAVVNGAGEPVGIVTEFDLVRLMYESNHFEAPEGVVGRIPAFLGYTREQLRRITVGELMTNDPETVSPDTHVESLSQSLFKNRRKVLLVTEGRKLVGVVRRIDLIRQVLG